MRTLTNHIVEGDPVTQLAIKVMDEPGAGGANHHYDIEHADNLCILGSVRFQDGPIKEAGVNGVTQEALLAIVIDRLRCFQAGPFASPYNASALAHCEAALSDLQARTRDRIARGVEGVTKA